MKTGRRKFKLKKIYRRAVIAALVIFVLAACAGLVVYSQRRLSNLVLGGLGEAFPTMVYGSPYIIGEQTWASPETLFKRLERLGYRKKQSRPQSPGEYFWDAPVLAVPLRRASGTEISPGVLAVYLRGFNMPQMIQKPGPAFLTLKADGHWDIRSARAEAISQAILEPELIAEFSGAQKIRREPSQWHEFPKPLIQAVIAAEDQRFFRHWGLDPRAIVRAVLSNLMNKGRPQGASTITQQLAKNMILSPRRTVRRKLAEAVTALYLEARYSKEEIMTLYLNHIYLGQDGPVSICGVKSAADFYFGKKLKDLKLDEAAVLAGLIKSPWRLNPIRDPEAAQIRRDWALRRMFSEGMISIRELEEALRRPLAVKPLPVFSARQGANAYFVAEVFRRLSEHYPEDELFRHGLVIHTTMDPLMQEAAQKAIRPARRQAALVALDQHTGRVLALAGGKEYGQSQFNRATQAWRQPGSAFKPFVYGAALEAGYTLAGFLTDKPRKFPKKPKGFWEPRNFDGVYHGTTTLRQALACSMNAATLDLAQQIGPASIASLAVHLGIESPLEKNLDLALGTSLVTLLELTAAYAPFSNGGFRLYPQMITAVTDYSGNTLEYSALERKAVVNPAMAYLITSALESCVKEGTAKSLIRLGWQKPAAGKTGTTNDGRDAWFIGYTPELLAGVWAGDDHNKPFGASGARDAVPLWASFMNTVLADYPACEFERPAGVLSKKIDPLTGLLAVAGCPQTKEEFFAEGTEPKIWCPLHRKGFAGWLRKLFGKK
ncbi:MAG: PBP1A family penicillin-binding protein [Elusimicrobia bacterium]|nr:PBP1A family penicillin-binding protein [Elusimicrobiota bacterium]